VYVIVKGMWLLWPLKRCCFGAKRRGENAKGNTGTVIVVANAQSHIQDDLRQHLRVNDVLEQQSQSRLIEEVSTIFMIHGEWENFNGAILRAHQYPHSSSF
jgi:hypothetical protein